MLRRALLLALLLTATLCGCPAAGDKKGKKGMRGKRGPETVSVAVEAARIEPVRESLEGHAALEPEAVVDVPSQATGLVRRITVEAGSAVHSGQVLAKLDDTRAQLALQEAELGLGQAKTQLARQEGLAKQGLAKQEDLETARDAVAQAKLTLQTAKLNLADTELKSPIDGIVTERLIERGAHLKAADIAFRVADPDPLLGRVRLPEAQAERVRPGQKALVKIEGRERPIVGRVVRVAPFVEMGSGTVVVTVAVAAAERRGRKIRFNRFANVEIIIAERARALTIPHAALAIRGEEDRVLVAADVREGKRGAMAAVRQRKLEIGVRRAGRVEVKSGLKEGELVVTAAPDGLRDGTQVRIVRQSDIAAVASATQTAAKTGAKKTGAKKTGRRGRGGRRGRRPE